MAPEARVSRPRRPRPALFVVCRRPGCGKTRRARFPAEVKRGGYCSNRCCLLDHQAELLAGRGLTKRTTPLYIECQRPGCGRLRSVRSPYLQRQRRYCSQRCNGLAHANVRKGAALGAARAAAKRKREVVQRIVGLTPLEAFREGYKVGLRSKCSQIRKRYLLLKKPA